MSGVPLVTPAHPSPYTVKLNIVQTPKLFNINPKLFTFTDSSHALYKCLHKWYHNLWYLCQFLYKCYHDFWYLCCEFYTNGNHRRYFLSTFTYHHEAQCTPWPGQDMCNLATNFYQDHVSEHKKQRYIISDTIRWQSWSIRALSTWSMKCRDSNVCYMYILH